MSVRRAEPARVTLASTPIPRGRTRWRTSRSAKADEAVSGGAHVTGSKESPLLRDERREGGRRAGFVFQPEVLTRVDLTLTGSLIIIVIFSSYENFVSKIDESTHKDWPEWMGKIDFTGRKLKLMSSMIATSAIQVLKAFMNLQ